MKFDKWKASRNAGNDHTGADVDETPAREVDVAVTDASVSGDDGEKLTVRLASAALPHGCQLEVVTWKSRAGAATMGIVGVVGAYDTIEPLRTDDAAASMGPWHWGTGSGMFVRPVMDGKPGAALREALGYDGLSAAIALAAARLDAAVAERAAAEAAAKADAERAAAMFAQLPRIRKEESMWAKLGFARWTITYKPSGVEEQAIGPYIRRLLHAGATLSYISNTKPDPKTGVVTVVGVRIK